MVRDFSAWEVYDGAHEGSGRSEKISIVRINEKNKKRPSHEAVLEYINEHYPDEVKEFIEQIKF